MKTPWAIVSALVLVLASTGFAGKLGSKLSSGWEQFRADDHILAWVFFTDKGSCESLRDAVPFDIVSERSLQRRLKVRALADAVDYTDLPVEESYVSELRSQVSVIRHRSKWFNAVSVLATKEQITAIEALPFVSKVELVYRAKTTRELENATPVSSNEGTNSTAGIGVGHQVLDLNYGSSLSQNQQINVPTIHNTGNYAQGVLVGVFDNGFRLLTHESFDTLRPRIVRTYDFVDHKVSVVPNNTSTAFGSHGVNTLSTIGGYKAGSLIGPAWGASFILARTENDSSETPIEEDNWVRAIEWADSLGVDVTSTSLGYSTYDPPYTGWTWQDMNGNTTLITRAADMAVGKGIVVVNSAGNDGFNPSHNTLGAPADGDSVLAVGAVTTTGTIASFSSSGPTTSIPPRIKPDICAQGTSVRVASSTNTTGYTTSQGTSFSCPLAAGVVALIIKARPSATPMQIGNALRSTASRSSNPDNQYGWGIINAVAAINAISLTSADEVDPLPSGFALAQNYPNPFNPSTTIRFSLAKAGSTTLKVFDLLGREVATLVNDTREAGSHQVMLDARTLASGTYFYRLQSGENTAVRKLVLVR